MFNVLKINIFKRIVLTNIIINVSLHFFFFALQEGLNDLLSQGAFETMFCLHEVKYLIIIA